MKMQMFSEYRRQLVVVMLIFAGWHVKYSEAQNGEICRLPSGGQGVCLPIIECTLIYNLVLEYKNKVLPEPLRNYIKASLCTPGVPLKSDSKICCNLTYQRTTTSTPMKINHFTVRPPSPEISNELIFVSPNEDFESTLNPNGRRLLMNTGTCGTINTNRVAFGIPAKLGEFPWMALLRYDNPRQPFQCSGTLITNRYILTAAHCVVGTENKVIGVRLGEYNTESEEDCETRGDEVICYRAEDFDIETITPHEQYRKRQYYNDIALIKLDRDVIFKRNIKPICLPVTNKAAQLSQYPPNYILTGWGTTELNKTSAKLLLAELIPRSRSYCQSNFTTRVTIRNEHICAGGLNRIDSCKGDSGGPLIAEVVYSLTYRYVIYGVVSFGVSGCGGEKSYPGVYASVVHFMPWITSKLVN